MSGGLPGGGLEGQACDVEGLDRGAVVKPMGPRVAMVAPVVMEFTRVELEKEMTTLVEQ